MMVEASDVRHHRFCKYLPHLEQLCLDAIAHLFHVVFHDFAPVPYVGVICQLFGWLLTNPPIREVDISNLRSSYVEHCFRSERTYSSKLNYVHDEPVVGVAIFTPACTSDSLHFFTFSQIIPGKVNCRVIFLDIMFMIPLVMCIFVAHPANFPLINDDVHRHDLTLDCLAQ